MDRYARQIAIGGWDQSSLAAATVVIAGAGWTGFLCALMATALGFGRIVLVGRGTRVPDAVGLARIVAGSPKAWHCPEISNDLSPPPLAVDPGRFYRPGEKKER